MLKLFRTFTRNVYSSSSLFCNSKGLPPNLYNIMSKLRVKYDGRSKKRRWEERRSDRGESLGFQPKQVRLENEQVEGSANARKTDKQDVNYEKIKRRKFVLMLGYSGVNYYGMQRNPGMKTIEEELLKALLKVNLIDQISFEQVQNMAFQRAARTDKGVSALRQIVSMKLSENYDLDKINQELPEDIRVFGCKRVTKGFNSKSQCDSRTYIYLLPTVAFANQNLQVEQKSFRLSDETFVKVNEVLKLFLGTKNYHNYTSKKKPSDPSAKRYMREFECEKPFIKQDVEFAILRVRGQSFMLHQIRKMVGMLLAVIRGLTTEETLQSSFGMDRVNVPRAPGLGLMLDYAHYERYNYRYGEDGMHPKLTWDEVDDKVREFSDQYIFPTIIEKEINDQQMVYWMETKLSRHRYDDFENYSDDENEELGDDDDDDADIKSETQQTHAEDEKVETESKRREEKTEQESQDDNFKCKDRKIDIDV